MWKKHLQAEGMQKGAEYCWKDLEGVKGEKGGTEAITKRERREKCLQKMGILLGNQPTRTGTRLNVLFRLRIKKMEGGGETRRRERK